MLYEESVTAWLEQLKAGHSSAPGKVWQRYVEQLVRLARRKLRASPRRERAIKRGGGLVRGESAFGPNQSNLSHQYGLGQVADPDPTPAFAIEMTEQVRELPECLDESQQRIALGRLEGYTNRKLAERLGLSLRAVEHKLNLIRRKWDADSE
jgi:DNA-binding NarL/FixJ family response regulator